MVCPDVDRAWPVPPIPVIADDRPAQILFLNKIDIFREKLPVSPMSHYFPEYRQRGDDLDYDAACAFLLDKFSSLNQNPEKSVYAVRRATQRREEQP